MAYVVICGRIQTDYNAWRFDHSVHAVVICGRIQTDYNDVCFLRDPGAVVICGRIQTDYNLAFLSIAADKL